MMSFKNIKQEIIAIEVLHTLNLDYSTPDQISPEHVLLYYPWQMADKIGFDVTKTGACRINDPELLHF